MVNLELLRKKLGLKGTSINGSTGNFIGDGTPEGTVTASPGARYFDKLNNADYVKVSGMGNTGWQ